MSLTSQLPNLNTAQLKSLHATMVNAGLAHETGGNPRELFRRAKYRHIGLMRRIYALLETAERADIERMADTLTEIMQ